MNKKDVRFKENKVGLWLIRWGVAVKNARVIAAMDQAAQGCWVDVQSERMRMELIDKMILSCTDGREFPFERLAAKGTSVNAFYRERARFVRLVLYIYDAGK